MSISDENLFDAEYVPSPEEALEVAGIDGEIDELLFPEIEPLYEPGRVIIPTARCYASGRTYVTSSYDIFAQSFGYTCRLAFYRGDARVHLSRYFVFNTSRYPPYTFHVWFNETIPRNTNNVIAYWFNGLPGHFRDPRSARRSINCP